MPNYDIIVRCRTGSLEKFRKLGIAMNTVRCRTGSLENNHSVYVSIRYVRCRTGSLENPIRAF